MDSRQLRETLRRVLLFALAATPLVACGGRSDGAPPIEPADAATPPQGAGSGAGDTPAAAVVGDAASEDVVAEADGGDPGDGQIGPCAITATYSGGYGGGADCYRNGFEVTCSFPVPATPTLADCQAMCPSGVSSCSRIDAGPSVRCYGGCGGRKPAGFTTRSGAGALGSVGAFFAHLAELEAAAIDAFRILRDELAAHGAPLSLLEAAERAARDEVRHTKIARAIAKRHGCDAASVVVPPHAPRSLEAIAIENAVEGCVRETFGALVAMHQGARASDPAIARAMTRIAEDEGRHAAFSWELASWLDARLDDGARERVRAAAAAAIDDLAAEASIEPSLDVRALAGYPSAGAARRMIAQLRTTLWTNDRAAA